MRFLGLIITLVKAGEILMTCEQALEYCQGGVFIASGRICVTYPDEVDSRAQTCLSDEPWLCNQLEHFRKNQHNETLCVQNAQNGTVDSIGAKLKSIRLWDADTKNGKNLVPFYFDGAHSAGDQGKIRNAFRELSDSIDCIEIAEVSQSSNYQNKIRVISGGGCYSYLGRISTRSGYQTLSLGRGCVQNGVIQHEMMHALGFDHEQNRPDRNNFIKIDIGNVQPNSRDQFEQLNSRTFDDLGSRYEIGSVMHYSAYAFAINRNRPVIIDRATNQPVKAQRVRISSLDILEICTAYNCGCKNANGISFCESRGTNPMREEFYWNTRKCDGITDCKNGADETNCNGNPATTPSTGRPTTIAPTIPSNSGECCKTFTIGAVKFELTSMRIKNRPVYNALGGVGNVFFSCMYQRWVFARTTTPSRKVFGYASNKYEKCPTGTWRVITDNGHVISQQMQCLSTQTTQPTTTTTTLKTTTTRKTTAATTMSTKTKQSGGQPTCQGDVKCLENQITIVGNYGCTTVFSFKIPALAAKTRVLVRLEKVKIESVKILGPFEHKLTTPEGGYNYIRIKGGIRGPEKQLHAVLTLTGAACDISEKVTKTATVMLLPY